MVMPAGDYRLKTIGAILSASLPFCMYFYGITVFSWLIPFSVFIILAYLLLYHNNISAITGLAGKGVFGIIYTGLFLSYIIGIKTTEQGGWWLLFLFSIIWSNDTFAYLIGKGFGNIKLAPQISPNKTVEGAFAGIIGGILAAIIFNTMVLKKLDLFSAVLLAIMIGILSQLGDLFESMLKRGAGVKDSGSIIPGHGGILDRIDSALIPLPFFYHFLMWS
ncbi:MAG: hypothetical protein A2073_03355 [Deltaproteobacteria bacterium GWC2_42_11]|nr:MAG: hypothetical protein A2073_03355 [Deltaproteobacteria bacterium GWC2_42_11]